MSRVVEVPVERLPRWLAGFAERHDGAVVDGGLLTGGDAVTAELTAWSALDGATSAEELARLAQPPTRLGLVLVRRGGYAVALADGDRLVERKVGRRHVQGRTAAGGWSQQRFARRRGHQADELVGAVAGHAARLLEGRPLDGLVTGGDRRLLAAVLEEARLPTAGLPVRELFDLPDPTPSVLATALARARSVRVVLSD